MDNLKKLRGELGVSQTEIANLLEVHVNTYRLWEQGAGQPNDDNREKLEELLEMEV